MKSYRVFSFFLGAVSLLICARVSAQPAPDPKNTTAQNSVALARVVMALPAGTLWVNLRSSTTFCSESGLTRSWPGGSESQELPPYAAPFKTTLEPAGYRVVTPGEDNLFDSQAGSADLQVAAVIVDERVTGCLGMGGFGVTLGEVRGESIMKVDW